MLTSRCDVSVGAGAACLFVPALCPANVLSSWLHWQPAEQWMAGIHTCFAARCYTALATPGGTAGWKAGDLQVGAEAPAS